MTSLIVSALLMLFVSSFCQAGRIPPSSSAVKNLNQQFLDYESNLNRQNPNKQNVQPGAGGLNSKPVSQSTHGPVPPINTPAKPTVNQNLNAQVGKPADKPILGNINPQLPVAHGSTATHGQTQNSHVHLNQPAGKPVGNVPQSHGVTNQHSNAHVGVHEGKHGSSSNPQSPQPTHGVTNQDLNKHFNQQSGKPIASGHVNPQTANDANKKNPYDTNYPALPTGQNVKQLVQLYNSRDEEARRSQMSNRQYKYSDVVAGTHKSGSSISPGSSLSTSQVKSH